MPEQPDDEFKRLVDEIIEIKVSLISVLHSLESLREEREELRANIAHQERELGEYRELSATLGSEAI